MKPAAMAVLLALGSVAQAGQPHAAPDEAEPSATATRQLAQAAPNADGTLPPLHPQLAQSGQRDGTVRRATYSHALPVIITTGSRSERELREIPASANSIDDDELEARHLNDIREVADTMPNVTVERRSNHMGINTRDGRSGNSSFNIRGLDGNRVLMLVDGVRMPRHYSFGASSRDNVDIGLVERIEIIKGPSSALYGSDGIGGVVQFFTRDPASYLKEGQSLGGQAGLAYEGESRTVRLGATVAGAASDQVQWLLSGSSARGHALKNRGDNASYGPLRTEPNPEDNRDHALLGKLVWKPDARQTHTFSAEHVTKQDELTLLAQYGASIRGVTTLSAAGETDNRRNRLSWQGRFELDAAAADTLRTTVAWQKLRSLEHYENTREQRPPQVRDTTDHEDLWQFNAQAEKTLRTANLAHKFSYGADVSRTRTDNLQTGQTPPAGETFPLKRFPDTTETMLGLYVQNEIIGDGWSLIPGLRWDRYRIATVQAGFGGTAASLSGSAVSPRLGATFNLDDAWTLYAQWASGFRTPGADQLNRFFENPIGFYKTIPNPELKPERAQHVELGIKGESADWRLEASVFHGRYRDFILDNQRVAGRGTATDPLVFQSVNTGRTTIHGFEMAAEYRLRQLAGGTLSLPASFGMARGRSKDNDQPLNSIQPPRLNLGLHYERGDWSARLDVTHRRGKNQKDVAVPSDPRAARTVFFRPASSTTLNLGGQWRVWRHGSGEVRLNAAIHNLTDRKYWRWSDVQGLAANLSTLDAYSQPGRTISLGVTATF
ncbi:MAG: TonB-dependent hemoglobin/transferrin/lactoferrin family receptor [Lautropia sp.]|nr:TonB-dependent hemoglobin/transferrin/lactoferrin family receptor [Lautropia sp.]